MSEQNRFNAQFRETKKHLNAARAEIIERLGKPERITGQDRVRLTRVLQMLDRYQPDRTVPEPRRQWLAVLRDLYRLLRPQKIDTESKHAGLNTARLTEESIETLRALRGLDMRMAADAPDKSDPEWLSADDRGEVLSQEVLDTSITLEYERKNWGVERICLDGIQNHLSADSKGEHCWVRCEVAGKWVTIAEAQQVPDQVTAVRFADDGSGFDVKNLMLLYSTKSDEPDSKGQFGEGMKMMAAAAVREGLDPEIESQSWRARPIIKDVSLYDARNDKQVSVQQLAFSVEHLSGEPLPGSRTTFRKPTKAFLNEVFAMDTKVLELREGYRPLFSCPDGDIVSREPGSIYVKGLYICAAKTAFSYNFSDVETNRDRNAIVSVGIETLVHNVVEALSNRRLIGSLLRRVEGAERTICLEARYCGEPDFPELWLEAFYEQFGADSVIATKMKNQQLAEMLTVKRVKLPPDLVRVLTRAGVKTDQESVPDSLQEVITTSLTIETGKDVWGPERTLLDAIQNHLPVDSGGSMINLAFRTRDGEWHDFDELPGIKNEEIADIRIYDNGRGYDHRLLGFIYSDKPDESSGKFGEGLKMLSIAALRQGMALTLSSRQWKAQPRSARQVIDGKTIDQLVFDVQHRLNESQPDDDRLYQQTSATTFHNPTEALLQEFRNIHTKVLGIEQRTRYDQTSTGEILELDGGVVFVRQLLIPGEHHVLFSYHFPKIEIANRDRNIIGKRELSDAIAQTLREVKNPHTLRTFLLQAHRHATSTGGKELLEFIVDFQPVSKENWKAAFEAAFGRDTSVRDVKSEDFNEVHQNLHVGLSVITMPSSVYRMLAGVGLPTVDERIREMTDVVFVENEELSSAELKVIKVLEAIDEYLPHNRQSTIRIYRRKHFLQSVAGGYSDGQRINILRSKLRNLVEAADVYFHEKTHHNTGSSDADADFRNYLTLALARLALSVAQAERPDLGIKLGKKIPSIQFATKIDQEFVAQEGDANLDIDGDSTTS